jgi:hypothetical protein
MSEAFSQSPPVYSSAGGAHHSTPYPTSTSSMPMPSGGSTSHSYPYGYPQTQIPQDVYRESMQSAVLTKVRNRLDDTLPISNAQIVSLKKTEQDLIDGDKKIQSLINDAQQQQTQAQVYIFSFFYSLSYFSFS